MKILFYIGAICSISISNFVDESFKETSIEMAGMHYTRTSSDSSLGFSILYDKTLLIADSTFPTAGIMSADLNKDGNLDMVLAKGRHNPAKDEIIFGDGHGGILSRYLLPHAADNSYGGGISDIDLDGDLDIVIGNDNPDEKLIYLNNGKGDFSTVKAFGNPNWETRYCTVADINLDGAPDIIVANRASGNNASVILFNTKQNNGWGNFPVSTQLSAEPSTSIAIGDFNSDGKPDMVVPNRNGGQSYIYWGPTFTNKIAWGPANAQYRMAKVADFNADGKPDLAVISTDAAIGLIVFIGTGDGHFNPMSTGLRSASVPYALQVGDLNKDGLTDMVVGYIHAKSVAFLHQYSNGVDTWKKIEFGDNNGAVYGIDILDFNKDGIPDIAIGRSDADSQLFFGSLQR